ncbi:MAG TPA: hypothetical protein VD998_01525 [Verrucomicrobiae bacterium]|nr:hypothetical protein [Verrucomicrobiae bacterium]
MTEIPYLIQTDGKTFISVRKIAKATVSSENCRLFVVFLDRVLFGIGVDLGESISRNLTEIRVIFATAKEQTKHGHNQQENDSAYDHSFLRAYYCTRIDPSPGPQNSRSFSL